ncbi:MAG: hypothetical protein OXH12_09565 [Chloroflexi bacterium]|nr:hypothetical protein [Chloroflexota bacterium]
MTAADPSQPPRGTLAPRIWLPIVALLVAAVVVLAVLLILNGGDDGPVTVVCEPGTPGCELRQGVHWHADFALYIRGERYDFNQAQFFSTEERELSENVHLHGTRDSVVHVHREGTTWREFFDSLGFELTDQCLTTPEGEQWCNSETERLSFVLNGVRVDGLAFQDITDIDRALISFGSEGDDQLMQQYSEVTDEACIVSLLCQERIPEGGIEDEPCTGGSECN